MLPLVTVADMHALRGIAAGDADPIEDAKFQLSINAASAAVSAYADRDFGAAPVVSERRFEYDDSAFLDVDDCSAITAVTLAYGVGPDYVLDPATYRAEPFDRPITTYLMLPTWFASPSPEMGFTNNLDQIGYGGALPIVKVTATWGWPVVPDDVKMATLLTAESFSTDPDAYQSESIAGYSRSRGPFDGGDAIPARAKELLVPYLRIKVA